MNTTIRFGNSPLRPGIKKLTNKSTYPAYSTIGTGTWTSSAKTCTATDVDPADIVPGDYIYSADNNQVRQIVRGLEYNNTFLIDEAFDANVTGESLKIIRQENLVRGYSFKNVGTGDAIVDGTTYEPEDPSISWFNPNGVAPIAYDAATNSTTIFLCENGVISTYQVVGP